MMGSPSATVRPNPSPFSDSGSFSASRASRFQTNPIPDPEISLQPGIPPFKVGAIPECAFPLAHLAWEYVLACGDRRHAPVTTDPCPLHRLQTAPLRSGGSNARCRFLRLLNSCGEDWIQGAARSQVAQPRLAVACRSSPETHQFQRSLRRCNGSWECSTTPPARCTDWGQ